MNTMKKLTVFAIAMSALTASVGASEAMGRNGGHFGGGFHSFGGHGQGIHRQFGPSRISCFACNLPRGGYHHRGWDYGHRHWDYGYGRYYGYGYGKPWRYGYWGRGWNRWYYWPRPVVYGGVVEPVAAAPVAPLATPAVLAAPVAEAPASAPAPAAAVTCTAAPGGAVTCSAVTPPVVDAR